MSLIVALIDVNNCFASAERVFQPELMGKPLVVLSSNDGCAIARSVEAKALGIKMAAPYYEFRHLEGSRGLIVRSANFSLYTNLSERIRSILETFTPSMVPYSIDESFLDFTGLEHFGLETYAHQIRSAVLQQTGMPTGIGIGTSKTLAKAAQWATKQYPATRGVVDIATDPKRRKRLLDIMPVGEVWGVGKATATKLEKRGITCAGQLAQSDPATIKQHFGVMLSRTAMELQGVPVLAWEEDYQVSQQIIASRSLGEKTDDRETLFASIAHHVERGARKLRAQKASAQQICVSFRTNAFASQDRQYAPSVSATLIRPTADSSMLVAKAKQLFDQAYRPGYRYGKTGIVLSGIELEARRQEDLFAEQDEAAEGNDSLMNAFDAINQRFGLGTLTVGSVKQGGDWQPKAEMRSPNYTGDWGQLPLVRA
jgi:DNA polymerase V